MDLARAASRPDASATLASYFCNQAGRVPFHLLEFKALKFILETLTQRINRHSPLLGLSFIIDY